MSVRAESLTAPHLTLLRGESHILKAYWAVFPLGTPRDEVERTARQRAADAGATDLGEVRILEHTISYYGDSPWKALIATVELGT